MNDAKAVALVGNGSFIEMAVNAKTYTDAGIMVMASACAISECFESPNIVSTNEGPLPSDLGASLYAQENLGAKNIACIGLNIPDNGIWSCQAVIDMMTKRGGTGSMAMLNPGAPDVNSALLEAVASGADMILLNLPAGLAIAVLKAAQEQNLRDSYKWIAPTTMYDLSVPAAIGEYWDGKVFVQAELAPISVNGPDAQNWLAVMDAYGKKDDPRDRVRRPLKWLFTGAAIGLGPFVVLYLAPAAVGIRLPGWSADWREHRVVDARAALHARRLAVDAADGAAGGFAVDALRLSFAFPFALSFAFAFALPFAGTRRRVAGATRERERKEDKHDEASMRSHALTVASADDVVDTALRSSSPK